MHAEVIGDLLNRHAGITVLRDPHDIVTELTGVGLGHSDILPACPQGKPSRMSPIGAADPSGAASAHEVAGLSLPDAAARYIKILRDATHGHGSNRAANTVITNTLLAHHDGQLSHDLPLLGYLYLLDILTRPNDLAPTFYRNGSI
ncbi:hypothetical protein F4553_008075 [Allocatelliglobosispora scoriae]|uniref:Uncharacterized protein n=1 Tax=Allocatelliglobosispora scoriae TaxID=643052 RepID=A0A841C776_9ACTN|nr:hypothetical protein [Allocatelliglobosispora scoriae]MBB5874641.1 hypothetical protein [Allocatelliglobosispora scoriae]